MAVDRSEWSLRAVEATRDLAAALDASVLVVHVKPVVDDGTREQVPLESMRTGNHLLAQERAILRKAGVEVSLQLRAAAVPHVAEEIVAAAQEFGADLIAVGAQGHPSEFGIVPGSVARGVLHRAHRPVLVVP